MKYLLVCTRAGVIEECEAENIHEALKGFSAVYLRDFKRGVAWCSEPDGEHFIIAKDVCHWLKRDV